MSVDAIYKTILTLLVIMAFNTNMLPEKNSPKKVLSTIKALLIAPISAVTMLKLVTRSLMLARIGSLPVLWKK